MRDPIGGRGGRCGGAPDEQARRERERPGRGEQRDAALAGCLYRSASTIAATRSSFWANEGRRKSTVAFVQSCTAAIS